MARVFPILKSNPVVEAQMVLNFNAKVQLEEQGLKKFLADNKFLNIQPIFQATVKLDGTVPTQVTVGHRGELNSHVLQVFVNGFSLSQVSTTYSGWEALSKVFFDLWSKFTAQFEITNIFTLSVRYINRLQIPSSLEFASEYWLPAVPGIGKSLGLSSGYFSKVDFALANTSAKVGLAQMLETVPAPTGYINLIADILISIQKDYKVGDSAILKEFESLREYKNVVFFDNLTEKGLKLYT